MRIMRLRTAFDRRPPRNEVTRVAPMNPTMRKSLEMKEVIFEVHGQNYLLDLRMPICIIPGSNFGIENAKGKTWQETA